MKILRRLELQFDGTADQHRPSDGRGLVCRSLSYLLVSRHGLSESELLNVLEVPRAVLSPLLFALQESIISATGLFKFYHVSYLASIKLLG